MEKNSEKKCHSGCYSNEQNTLLFLLIRCISTRSAPQTLSIKNYDIEGEREGGCDCKLLFCEWSSFWMDPQLIVYTFFKSKIKNG